MPTHLSLKSFDIQKAVKSGEWEKYIWGQTTSSVALYISYTSESARPSFKEGRSAFIRLLSKKI